MNLTQKFRRLGQMLDSSWGDSFRRQDFQFELIKKLYAKNGLDIKMTCPACPEQYEVFKDGDPVGYFRLRHGTFRVDYPTCGGETIYCDYPAGDGMFDDNERSIYLTRALRAIQDRIKQSRQQQQQQPQQ